MDAGQTDLGPPYLFPAAPVVAMSWPALMGVHASQGRGVCLGIEVALCPATLTAGVFVCV